MRARTLPGGYTPVLKDKYGVSWQIVPAELDEMLADNDRQRAADIAQDCSSSTRAPGRQSEGVPVSVHVLGEPMSQLFSRRKMIIGAGGVAALAPIVALNDRAQAAPLPATLVALTDPIRVFDSRTASPALGGGKIAAGSSVGVSVGGIADSQIVVAAVFVNVTVTDTEGRGYLVVRGSDLTGQRPLPPTSNVNWWSDGQTVANLVITAVGGENTLEVHAGGSGRTHFIVDVQAYVPSLVVT